MPLSHIANPRLLGEVAAAVRAVLRDPDLRLTLATELNAIPDWDSVDLIGVIVELECRFDVLFELPELDTLYTVGDVVRSLAAKCSLAAA
jgi:acyl carrier protein